MRKLTIVMFFVFFSSGFAQLNGGKWGPGLKIGEPFGLSVNYRLNKKLAIDVDFGFGWEDENAADYTMENLTFVLIGDLKYYQTLFDIGKGELPFYAGIGFRTFFKYERFGIRLPLGISYLFEKVPLALFIEYAPTYTFKFESFVQSTCVGFRYYF